MPVTPYFNQDIRDDNLKIAMGVYPGVASFSVYGRNRTVAAGAEEEISSLSAAAVYPATALMTSISPTILGVSFSPRAKLIAPALMK